MRLEQSISRDGRHGQGHVPVTTVMAYLPRGRVAADSMRLCRSCKYMK